MLTPYVLRARCRAWPAPVVAAAVRRALAGADMEDVAPMVAHWLISETDDDAPPLPPPAIAAISRELDAARQ